MVNPTPILKPPRGVLLSGISGARGGVLIGRGFNRGGGGYQAGGVLGFSGAGMPIYHDRWRALVLVVHSFGPNGIDTPGGAQEWCAGGCYSYLQLALFKPWRTLCYLLAVDLLMDNWQNPWFLIWLSYFRAVQCPPLCWCGCGFRRREGGIRIFRCWDACLP